MSEKGSELRRVSKLIFRPVGSDVTDDEVEYFRDHPDELEEVSAPVSVHIVFLWLGTILGLVLVAASKLLNYSGVLDSLSIGSAEFLVDVVFEIGVALIGAAVTAYLLGILLNQQQRNVSAWRAEVRRRIDSSEAD